MVTILGGVFSHKEGFTTITQMIPGLAFHAVTTALGLVCIMSSPKKQASAE